MSPEKKQTIVDLLRSGRRSEAIRYAVGAFDATEDQATRLVDSLARETRPGWRIDPGSIVGRAFSALGAIFLVVVISLYWNDLKSSRGTIRVTGKVVRLQYNGSGAVPVIEYHHLGKDREHVGSVSSSPPAFAVGEEVELLVDANDPDQVIVNSFLERYFLILLFGIFAVVFGGVGLVVLRFVK